MIDEPENTGGWFLEPIGEMALIFPLSLLLPSSLVQKEPVLGLAGSRERRWLVTVH